MTRLRDMFLQENRRWAVIALCGTLLLSAFAQQPTPLPVSDVLTARSFAESSPIQFSPDGKWLAYTVRANRESKLTRQDDFLRAGVPTGAKGADIFVVETGTGGSRMVTGGLGENWLPVWSPNGHYLAMLSDRDGDSLAKLWIWEVATGTLRKVSEVNVRANQLEWLPDSRAVLVSILPEHVTPVEFVATLTGAMRTQSSETVSSDTTVAIYRSSSLVHDAGSTSESPPWNLDYSLCDLGVIDVASGSVQRIDRGHRISGYFLAPDGSQVAYTSPQSFQKPGSQQVLFNVAVVSLSTGQLRTIASDVQLAFGGASVRWSPNSSMLAYRTGGMDAQGDCYVIDPKGGLSRNVTSFVARHAGYAHFPPLWDSKGRHIFFTDGHVLWKASPDESQATQVTQIPGHRLIRLIEDGIGSLWSQEDGQSTIVPAFDESSKQFEFYRIDLGSSRIAPLLKIGQNPLSLELDLFAAVSRDGLRLAYFSQDAQHDMDLWLTDPSFTDPRRLTHINPEFDRYQMGAARQLDWLSLDGELLHGALLLPDFASLNWPLSIV